MQRKKDFSEKEKNKEEGDCKMDNRIRITKRVYLEG